MKRYVFKVYSSSGQFLSSLPDVGTEPRFSSVINGGLGELTFRLPRTVFSFEEGTVIAQDNIVRVVCFDGDATGGVNIYTGRISKYAPTIEAGGKEYVTVTCLGNISISERYILEDAAGNTTLTYNSKDPSNILSSVIGRFYAMGGNIFTTPTSTIDVSGNASASNSVEMTGTSSIYNNSERSVSFWIKVNSVDDSGPSVLTNIISHGDWGLYINAAWLFPGKASISSFHKYSTSIQRQAFSPVDLNEWVHLAVAWDEENSELRHYVNGVEESKVELLGSLNTTSAVNLKVAEITASYTGLLDAKISDLRVYDSALNIDQAKALYRGENILENLEGWWPLGEGTGSTVDDLISDNDGTIEGTYSTVSWSTDYPLTNTIAETSTTVSYSFNTYTVKEALDKIIELCPVGWYYYVDADNKITLAEKASTADHTFALGKDIISIVPENSSENMVNRIYFTGGDDASSSPIYKKYERTSSISTYGLHATKYVDSRITDPATADIVAGAILDRGDVPEVRTTIVIRDNNAEDGKGYDIESIKPGDTMKVLGYGSASRVYWDEAVWDVDKWDYKWDYDLSNVTSTVQQIVKVSYEPRKVTLEVSSKLPNVSKRVEDIRRNLLRTQTENNPTAPTT